MEDSQDPGDRRHTERPFDILTPESERSRRRRKLVFNLNAEVEEEELEIGQSCSAEPLFSPTQSSYPDPCTPSPHIMMMFSQHTLEAFRDDAVEEDSLEDLQPPIPCASPVASSSDLMEFDSVGMSPSQEELLAHRNSLSSLSSRSSMSEDDDDQEPSHVLPVVSTKKSAHFVSTETVADLMMNEESSMKYVIVDCRFDYEFRGGHIRGALNLASKDEIQGLYNELIPGTIVLFHCEFSSQRGPRGCQCFRNFDRRHHLYPFVNYPDVYVIEGGYKKFFKEYPDLCEPYGYTRMVDPKHSHELIRSRSSVDFSFGRKGSVPHFSFRMPDHM
eukprot:TRINITY_DN2441_c0_g1_i1.p1 TRINITY_DN2441_c0_g1~~TRINITY_DN2441_c0_g1_i1.p1  ORF type:complete len:331 (-),score=72.37 TRINITY_DN2441_c0_g1_i1:292-1284(-)